MSAFAFSGVCYETPESALAAFSRSLPIVDAVGVTTLSSAPSVSPGGVITWSVSNVPFSTGVAVTRSGTTQLSTCSVPLLDQFPVQSILFVAAVFFAAVSGFRAGFRP